MLGTIGKKLKNFGKNMIGLLKKPALYILAVLALVTVKSCDQNQESRDLAANAMSSAEKAYKTGKGRNPNVYAKGAINGLRKGARVDTLVPLQPGQKDESVPMEGAMAGRSPTVGNINKRLNRIAEKTPEADFRRPKMDVSQTDRTVLPVEKTAVKKVVSQRQSGR